LRRRLRKTKFRVCVFLGFATVILLSGLTDFYDGVRNYIDDPEDAMAVLKGRLWGPTRYWLFQRWSWQPTNSDLVNINIAILHVVLIAFIVPVALFLIWFLSSFAYLLPLLVGLLAGYAAAFLTNGLSILLSEVGAGFTQVSYEHFSLKGGLIAIYFSHVLLIGFSLYFVTPLLRKLGSGPAKLVYRSLLKPILVGIAVIYEGSSKRKAAKTKMITRRRYEIAPHKAQVFIPQVFDEGAIEAGLLEYRSDRKLLSTFLSGLAERYKDESQIKVIQKKLEKLKLGKEYLEVLYDAREAHNKLVRFDEKEELESQKRALEKKKLGAEIRIVDLETEVKRKELELKLARLQAEEAELKEGKKELSEEEQEQRLVEKAQREIANTIALEAAKIEGIFQRASFLAEQEEKIKEKYPAEIAARIIDLVDRMMTEEEDVG